jgi:hypothetical protein
VIRLPGLEGKSNMAASAIPTQLRMIQKYFGLFGTFLDTFGKMGGTNFSFGFQLPIWQDISFSTGW